jgi:hypothetical protein
MNDGLTRFVLGAIVVIGLSIGGWQLYQYWGKFKDKEPEVAAAVAPEVSGDQLPGMAPKLQPILDAARQRGATGLHDFLMMYGNTISDPRRAWIELDYVVLLAQSSPGQARQEFAKVKSRVPSSSPVYNRVKQLENTYD